VYSQSEWFLSRYEAFNTPEFVLTIPYHKVRKIAFKIIHSTTILLPEWCRIVADLALKYPELTERLIPRDVATRWNSTYNMLEVTLKYQKAIDIMTSARENGLRDYKLTQGEWKIAAQLCDILKVCHIL
jgi:hypothetical protein